MNVETCKKDASDSAKKLLENTNFNLKNPKVT